MKKCTKYFVWGALFSYTIMTYLKKLVGNKYFNTKQFPGGLPLRIILPVSKMFPPLMLLCCPHQVWTVPFPWNPGYREGCVKGGEGYRTHPTAKHLLIFSTRKILLYQKCHSYPIKWQLSYYHFLQVSFVAVVTAVVSLHKKWKFSFKDIFSKCDQIETAEIADLVKFTEEIFSGKLHFLCSVSFFNFSLYVHTCYANFDKSMFP